MAGSRRRRPFRFLCWLIAPMALLVAFVAVPSASAATDSITLDKTTYMQGNTINVTYTTTANNNNWVGIYKAGDTPGSAAAIKWAYANSSSGTLTFAVSGAPGTTEGDSNQAAGTTLVPGEYVAYLLWNNGYSQLANRHFWVGPTLSLDKSNYAAGETITAKYSVPDQWGPKNNWIGIYKENDTPGSGSSVAWKYATGASGSVTLSTSGLASGGYVAYYLYNDGYSNDLATDPKLGDLYSVPVHFYVGSPPSTAGKVPALDHVFMVMMENKAPSDIFGTSNNRPNCASPSTAPAPYLSQLACSNITLTNSHGLMHPSDPNYVALASAQVGIQGNNFSYVHSVGGTNTKHLGSITEDAGKTWKGYIEGTSSSCDLTANAPYDPDNLPFLYFKGVGNDTTYCQNHLKPISQFWTDLRSTSTTPNYVWFVPNSNNTMHNNCSPNIQTCVSAGDNWMKNNLPTLLNSPAFKTQKSLLIITWDEDRYWTSANPIPTIIVGSPNLLKAAGSTSNTYYNHYNVTRTVEDALGLTRMTANDANAIPIYDIWAS